VTAAAATRRLYREDPYATAFSARVLAVQAREVVLDETIFYPTAGGQQHDTGYLAGHRVVDVNNSGDSVVHILDAEPALEPGDEVSGTIDWARRFDHMQQHTGEHILGQAFFRLGRPVVSVAMGEGRCTLDLAGSITYEEALQAELIANEAVWAGLPVSWADLPETEALALPLRREPQVSGLIRVVRIGDFDYSACGGTHVRNSGEVGIVKVLGTEKVKGGNTRVYFHCGARALSDYRAKHDLVARLARAFSAGEDQVGGRLDAALAEAEEAKRELGALKTSLAEETASRLAEAAPVVGDVRLVVEAVGDATLLPLLARALAAREGVVALLAASADRTMLAVACGPGSGQDSRSILKAGLDAVGGRGGGKPELAQGSAGEPGRTSAALEAMRRAARAGVAGEGA
jgi:alanyl-tRNA synthetase